MGNLLVIINILAQDKSMASLFKKVLSENIILGVINRRNGFCKPFQKSLERKPFEKKFYRKLYFRRDQTTR
jgi:hypothetical protein